MTKKIKYPEHEKLRGDRNEHQAISSFLEWLTEIKNVRIIKESFNKGYRTGTTDFQPRELIVEYFDIDEKKFEKEKLDMLEKVRAL